MSNTKDKVEDEKFNLDEIFDKVNLIKYIDSTVNEMSKNSIESFMGEYNLIHPEDEVYLNDIRDLKIFSDLRVAALTKIYSKDNISQEERDYILNSVKSELDPRIEDLKNKIDTRKSEITSDRKDYLKESDEKNTPKKNTLLRLGLGTSTIALAAHPKTRKIIIDSGKKISGEVIKFTKLL
ncbi:MAG: hypothetical protein ACRCX2_08245 [Paraclostridium sp.]